MIAEPPVAPAVYGIDTVVPVPPSVTVPIVGACGTDTGVAEEEVLEALEEPLAFVATTVYVLAVPTTSDTKIGEEEPEAELPLDEVTV